MEDVYAKLKKQSIHPEWKDKIQMVNDTLNQCILAFLVAYRTFYNTVNNHTDYPLLPSNGTKTII